MEAVERFAEGHPELEPLAGLFRELSAGLRCATETRALELEAAAEASAKATVLADLQEPECLAAALEPEVVRLRAAEGLAASDGRAADEPPAGLTALLAQLRAAVDRSPEFSAAIGGGDMCKGLEDVLEAAGGAVAPAATERVEQWIQDFVRDTINEISEQGQQLAQFLEATLATVASAAEEVRECSEQICAPGYRSDRPRLIDRRSGQVQRLLGALAGKRRALLSDERGMAGLLLTKLGAFEEAFAVSARASQEKLQHHVSVAADAKAKAATLQRYAQRKACDLVLEEDIAHLRRTKRREEVQRLVAVLQQAFGQLQRLAEDCLRDAAALRRCSLEKREAQELTANLGRRLRQAEEAHEACSQRLGASRRLEDGLALWIRKAYSAMSTKVEQDMQALRASLPADEARMTALLRRALEQLNTLRERFARGIEHRSKEMEACKEELALLEFARPSSQEIQRLTRRLAELRETLRLQQREADALELCRQRLLGCGAAELLPPDGDAAATAAAPAGPGDEQRQLQAHRRSAEEWAGGIFRHFDGSAWAAIAEEDGAGAWRLDASGWTEFADDNVDFWRTCCSPDGKPGRGASERSNASPDKQSGGGVSSGALETTAATSRVGTPEPPPAGAGLSGGAPTKASGAEQAAEEAAGRGGPPAAVRAGTSKLAVSPALSSCGGDATPGAGTSGWECSDSVRSAIMEPCAATSATTAATRSFSSSPPRGAPRDAVARDLGSNMEGCSAATEAAQAEGELVNCSMATTVAVAGAEEPLGEEGQETSPPRQPPGARRARSESALVAARLVARAAAGSAVVAASGPAGSSSTLVGRCSPLRLPVARAAASVARQGVAGSAVAAAGQRALAPPPSRGSPREQPLGLQPAAALRAHEALGRGLSLRSPGRPSGAVASADFLPASAVAAAQPPWAAPPSARTRAQGWPLPDHLAPPPGCAGPGRRPSAQQSVAAAAQPWQLSQLRCPRELSRCGSDPTLSRWSQALPPPPPLVPAAGPLLPAASTPLSARPGIGGGTPPYPRLTPWAQGPRSGPMLLQQQPR